MFTGIIEALGRVASIEERGGDIRLCIATGDLDRSDVRQGDSISTSGVCLTAVEWNELGFVADVSRETVNRTTLGGLSAGALVNLEKAMLPTSRFGGHMVTGHVDGLGHIVNIHSSGRATTYQLQAPTELRRYIAVKGSITVDGVSLTVNDVDDTLFRLDIVPHTAEVTTFSHLKEGDRVNLEVDLVARYLESLLQAGSNTVAMDGK